MDNINSFLWCIATFLLLASGIYFAFKLKFLHFNIKEMISSLRTKNSKKDGISSFESLSVTLGSCIGVGSLAGVALAIYKGGVGTIFWMWLSCLLIAPNSLVENTLAIVYQQKRGKNLIGGPSYYIKNGLGYQKLALLYAVVIIFAYLFGFLTIQSNTIIKSVTNFYQISPVFIGILVAFLSFLIVRKGIKGIAKFSSFFVPLMGLVYLIISLFIIFKNINLLPNIFLSIIKGAFTFESIIYGFVGTMLIGIQRGIFSSEAGVGTSAIASGSSNMDNPIKQGFIGTIGVYFTTFIICTATAFIILTSNYNSLNYNIVNGIEITQDALNYHLGSLGNIILYFCTIAFAFSTIISGYYYIEANFKFVFKNIKEKGILILKIITCLLLVFGGILSPTFIWNIVDILVAILAIINIISIFKLRQVVLTEYFRYKGKCKDDRK